MESRNRGLSNSYLSYGVAFGSAILVAAIYWQVKTDWRGWKQVVQNPVLFAKSPDGTLAWKEPILPAQYAQASCGACHREDIPQTPRLNHGRQLIVRLNCVGCHRLQGIDRPEMLGPDLTSIGSKVSREWIYKWLKEPRTVADADGNVLVNGVATNPRMPKFQLSEEELRALSAFLSLQRTGSLLSRSGRKFSGIRPNDDVAIENGHTRFNQMFCVTCHSLAVDRGGEVKLIGGDIGPELTKVGSKVKPEWLVAWLRDPQSYLQHTRMPRYEWSGKDLDEVAQYILNRLTDPSLLTSVPRLDTPSDAEVQHGRELYVGKGCAECHIIQGITPRANFGPDLSAMGMAGGIRMIEAKAPRNASFSWHFVGKDVERIEVGESMIPRSLIDYIRAKITNPTSVTPENHMPAFQLSAADLDDLTTALLSMSGPAMPNQRRTPIVERPRSEYHPDGDAEELYQRYRCYVCHTFKGKGGTLAPDLSFEGSRSNRDWLIQFLMNPQTLRPNLIVRMPHFNMPRKEATVLADYISRSLQKPDLKQDPAEDAFTSEMAEKGKQLFGVKYQCQSCHTIGSSGGYVGPSLNNVGNWMTPTWIEAWLRAPQALVPGAIEPRHSFDEGEVRDLTAYLLTLRQSNAGDNNSTSATAGGGQP